MQLTLTPEPVHVLVHGLFPYSIPVGLPVVYIVVVCR